jgi:hypothetical protein
MIRGFRGENMKSNLNLFLMSNHPILFETVKLNCVLYRGNIASLLFQVLCGRPLLPVREQDPV